MRAGLKICCSLIFVMLLGFTGGTFFLFRGLVPLEKWLQLQVLPQGEIDFVLYVIIVVFVILILGLGLIFHFFIFGRVKRLKTGLIIIAALFCSSVLIYTLLLNHRAPGDVLQPLGAPTVLNIDFVRLAN